MPRRDIYVEIPIRADMEALWEHTQDPAVHQRWDLRFSRIEYLPRPSEDEPQRFLYETRIGFGLAVAGEGESVGERHGETGQRTSALKFGSDSPLALIRTGSGYWQYVPAGDHLRFLTRYDYQVRYGLPGRLADLVFRPLLGWATAWSFDALRLWLERAVPPEESLRRLRVHVAVHLALALCWIYQGLVPKILVPDSGEVEILRATGLFTGALVGLETAALALAGVAEVLFGVLFLLPLGPRPSRWLHRINVAALLVLALGALGSPALFVAPFNPVALTLAMAGLSVVGLLNEGSGPHTRATAGRCARKPGARRPEAREEEPP